MTQNFTITKCLLVGTEGSSLGDAEEYDLLGGDPRITYMESILSPAIGLTVNFFDASSVVSRKGLTGGEYIQLEIEDPESGTKFEIKADHKLIINGVKDLKVGPEGQEATFEAIPEELMVNETAKISKKYSGNIADIVKEILTSDVKGIQTSKTLDEESSSNKYSFIGNFRRPIDIIQWLQPKAACEVEGGESYGFLFWENLDGYHFKSIESLLKKEPEDGDKYEKIEVPAETPLKILDDNGDTNTDTVMNLRRGMYANKTIYVDLSKQIKTVDDFKVSDIGALEKLPKLPKGMEEKPTTLMFRITDPGAMQKDSKKVEGEEDAMEKQQDLAKIQNKSYARSTLLFSQSYNVALPFNPQLRAGNTIFLQFPLPDDDETKTNERRKLGDDKTNDPSGKYLIEGLKHIIGDGNAETQVSLIRDTFTAE